MKTNEASVQNIQVGTKVKWSSQAAGSHKLKSGTVIAIVPGGSRAERHLPKGISIRDKTHVKFDTNIAKATRYIVEVPRGGYSVAVDYYCPRVSLLRVQGDEA